MKSSHKPVAFIIAIAITLLAATQLFLMANRQPTVFESLAQVINNNPDNAPAIQMQWLDIPTSTPPPPPTQAPQAGNPAQPQTGGNQDVVAIARAQIGKMYQWGAPSRNWASVGDNPSQFDCSGLVGWAWHKASGGKVSMSGQTSADWNDSSGKYQKFTADQIDQLQPGDLVYFTNGRIHHVGMYSGSGCGDTHCFIDAPRTGKPVQETSLTKRNAGNDPMIGFLRPIVK